jgi:hypothetical protein
MKIGRFGALLEGGSKLGGREPEGRRCSTQLKRAIQPKKFWSIEMKETERPLELPQIVFVAINVDFDHS